MQKRNAVILALLSGLMMSTHALGQPRSEWKRYESEHFVAYSNDLDHATKSNLVAIENYHYVLNFLYGLSGAAEKQSPKFEMFLMKDREDLKRVWPNVSESVAGFYSQCSEGAIAYSAMDLREGFSSNSSRSTGSRLSGADGVAGDRKVLFHEYAHHFMFDHYTEAFPAWVVEGFAEYYETLQVKGKRVSIGFIDQNRHYSLLNTTWHDYADILRGTTKIETAEQSFVFYAQSWLLVHYTQTSIERTEAFRQFIVESNKGMDPVEAFEKNFKIKIKDLPLTLKGYLNKGTPVISFDLKDLPDPKIDITNTPVAANKVLLLQSQVRTCKLDRDGPDLLKAIRNEHTAFPSEPLAQLTRAHAEIIEGELKEAEPLLNAILSTQPNHAEALYLKGRMHLKIAEKPETNTTDTEAHYKQARSHLGRAYGLNPLHAPTLYYLSRAQRGQPGYPNETAINAAIQASNLAPAVDTYAFHAAHLMIMIDQPEDAEILLTPIANDPHGKAIASIAKGVIAAIRAKAPKSEILKAFLVQYE